MKKFLTRLIAINLAFSLSFLLFEAVNTKAISNNSTKQYFSFAQNFIVDFYENKDIGTMHDLNKYTNSINLLNILNNKANLHQYVTKKSFLQKINYKVTSALIEEKIKNSNYYLKFAVDVSFNYLDSKNDSSSYGEVVEMILNKDNKVFNILDCYIRTNYFDSYVLGKNLNIVNKFDTENNYTANINTLSETNINDKVNELKQKIDEVYEQEHSQPPITNSEVSLMTLSNLNKSSIVTWARNNFNKTSPSSGNGVVPYYDFSQISGAWDCTNFVSHALLAGGATVYNTGGTGISSTGWYFTNVNNRSSSWSSVNYLYSFITTNTTRGPVGTSFTYYIFDERNGYPYSQGDIMQFNDGSGWFHSAIITGIYVYSGYYYIGAKYTGRYEAGGYNDNTKAEETPNYTKRVIKLTGNYQ